jgi:hypothetical protein
MAKDEKEKSRAKYVGLAKEDKTTRTKKKY